MSTIAEKWDSFSAEVLPAEAGEVQRQEMRRAFFAGAAALYGIVMGGLSRGKEPTEADFRLLLALDEELQAFVGKVRRGLS